LQACKFGHENCSLRKHTGLTGRWGTHGGQNLAHDREIDGGAQTGADLLLDLSAVIFISGILINEKYLAIDFAQGNGGQRLHRRDPRRCCP
jgi:hypothetical protein